MPAVEPIVIHLKTDGSMDSMSRLRSAVEAYNRGEPSFDTVQIRVNDLLAMASKLRSEAAWMCSADKALASLLLKTAEFCEAKFCEREVTYD